MRLDGYVISEGFTRSSAEQRAAWFLRGIQAGDLKQCDTFPRSLS